MDASILVVGNNDFLAMFLEPVRDLAKFTLEVAPNPAEAIPLIQAQQPDLLVVQASLPETLDLCRQVKAQNRLAWMYCILIADLLHDKSLSDRALEIERRAEALEAGADAYLQLSLQPSHNPDHHTAQLLSSQKRLLAAQVQAGLRRIQNHRELMRTNDLLSAIALSDPLTELNNRRAFEWEFPRQIQNARNREQPISLIMLDVDFFKNINDSYGHLVGDRALQLLSARLRYNLRFYDTLFRYGGEEFVIILSETGCQEATLIATRLCRLISDQPFVINDTLDLKITISAGAASLAAEDDVKGISLLDRADQNLLQAKSQGRNRVIGCQECPDCQC